MFIPWRAEIPGGHRWPFATLVLIVANIAAAAVLGFAESEAFVRPRWLPAVFVHFDGVQLIANLFFLWAFGLVVEGVGGPIRFVALYAALGLVWSVVADAPGTDGIVCGLMAVAAVWAPRARMWIFVWLIVRAPRLAETTTLGACLFYVGWFVLSIVGYGVEAWVLPAAASLGAGVVLAAGMRATGLVGRQGVA